MTGRRIERPAELRDRDRRPKPAASLYEQLYHDERTAREQLAAVWRPSVSAAAAWGLMLGYAASPLAHGWYAGALALCAVLLHARAVRVARRFGRAA